MRKVNSIYNQLNNKKKAFTLIELLIVIAIIGILFIVLVSKVDFATDKAKASGVQTDFRSFQVALDTVAKENAGFNTFGYNTGDNAGAVPSGYAFETEALKNATIGDGIRNSYDQGDKNLNGKQDTGEVFTGRKIYTETWTEVYTLVKPGTTGLDVTAVFALESAINKNLDPKLHITIKPNADASGNLTGSAIVTMANQARDPWKNEYHGVYISQAERDNGADRGAIIIYSNGANGKWGSAHDITNGVVSVTVPGNNVNGKDDYSLVSCYSYLNGYGQVINGTTGFSNNQIMPNGNGMLQNTPNVQPDIDGPAIEDPDNGGDVEEPVVVAAGLYKTGTNFTEIVYSWQELLDEKIIEIHLGRISVNVTDATYSQNLLDGDLVFPNDASIKQFNGSGFQDCNKLKNVVMGSGMTDISYGFRGCQSLETVVLPDTITEIGSMAFYNSRALKKVVITSDIVTIKADAFEYCESLQEINLPNSLQLIEPYAFSRCKSLQSIVLPENLTVIGRAAFERCTSLQSIIIPASVQYLYETFKYCSNLTQVVIQGNNTEIRDMAFYECTNLSSINLGNNITTIGKCAFENCKALMSINFPNTLVSIGQYAFRWSGIGSDIVLPEGLTRIESGAFYFCPNISSMVLPSTLKFIGDEAFDTCKNMTQINLPYGLESIGAKAFRNCRLLTSVVIPDTVTTVGEAAYNYCDNLTSVTLSASMQNIPDLMFIDCWRLQTVVIPDGIATIGNNAFDGIGAMKSITIPSSVVLIEKEAFRDSYNLETIYFNGTEEQWEAIVKEENWDLELGYNADDNSHTYKVIFLA